MNVKEKRSLVVVTVLESKEMVHEFAYRRLADHPECMNVEKNYRALIRDMPTVRVVGMSPEATSKKMQIGDLPPEAPQKFKALMENYFWSFIRIETKKGCLAYFSQDCRLPENYSAGLSLEESAEPFHKTILPMPNLKD